jgi:hypothetical protein
MELICPPDRSTDPPRLPIAHVGRHPGNPDPRPGGLTLGGIGRRDPQLSVVSRLVRAAVGDVRVESMPVGGSHFTARLPEAPVP